MPISERRKKNFRGSTLDAKESWDTCVAHLALDATVSRIFVTKTAEKPGQPKSVKHRAEARRSAAPAYFSPIRLVLHSPFSPVHLSFASFIFIRQNSIMQSSFDGRRIDRVA